MFGCKEGVDESNLVGVKFSEVWVWTTFKLSKGLVLSKVGFMRGSKESWILSLGTK